MLLESKIAENLFKINSKPLEFKDKGSKQKMFGDLNTTNKSPSIEGNKKFEFDNRSEKYDVSINRGKLDNSPVSDMMKEVFDGYFNADELEYYSKRLSNNEKRQRSYEVNFNTFIKRGDLIGEGGFGKVYTGFDEVEGRVVAVKEIKIQENDHSKSVSLLLKLNFKEN